MARTTEVEEMVHRAGKQVMIRGGLSGLSKNLLDEDQHF